MNDFSQVNRCNDKSLSLIFQISSIKQNIDNLLKETNQENVDYMVIEINNFNILVEEYKNSLLTLMKELLDDDNVDIDAVEIENELKIT